jgi:8-oxo-dGTP diphosphatase
VKRLYPDQPVVGVGAVILSQGKILLEKRKNEPGRGKWSIPGGLVDLGESPEQAVIREVLEETCLEVEAPHLVDVVSDVSLDEAGKVKYHFVIIDYLVTVKRGEPVAASDADALTWVPFSEVEAYNLTRSFRNFFRRNRQRLEQV